MDSIVNISFLIPLLPLAGAVIAGFFGAKWLKGQSHWPIWLGVGASAVMSLVLLFGMIGEVRHAHEPAPAAAPGTQVKAEQAAAMPEAGNNGVWRTKDWYTWIEAGDFKATAGFFFDPLTAVMLCVVTCIGFLITVFSAGYMKGEEGYFRFFAYLGLFIFSMTCLVMGNNFIMLYLGWEGVGLCSYLLIGYYYERPAAREAAKKAFLVNRIGDFGFGLGIMLIFMAFGTVSYFGDGPGTYTGALDLAKSVLLNPEGHAFQAKALQWIPFLLMLGAFGKSAQFPLYVWLPDAMEGPTPVSALIHAATMVTAGVYMIARCSAMFFGNQAALMTIAAVGAFTALLAATIALRQFDLKKVFAYSTISQLGYMFVGVACLAPVAGVFHLVTHAFFKALLFLCSGVVMHAMAGELDMRKMSGVKRVLPMTNWLILIGCLALSGFPFLSGFFSKDEIVGAAFHGASAGSWFLGVVMLFTAFLTAYYTFRLYFRVFQGPEVIPAPPAGGHGHPAIDQSTADEHAEASSAAVHTGTVPQSGIDPHLAHSPDHGHAAHDAHGAGQGHDHAHNHEPLVMILPLILLAIGAVLAGYINWPREFFADFLGQSPSFKAGFEVARHAFGDVVAASPMGQPAEPESVFSPVMLVSALISIAGIALAYWLHLADRTAGDRLAQSLQPLTNLLEAKYWVDEIYQAAIVEPLRTLGRLFFAFDQWIIDGLVALVGYIPQLSGFALKLTTQRGYLQGYAAAMLLGVAIILLVIFV